MFVQSKKSNNCFIARFPQHCSAPNEQSNQLKTIGNMPVAMLAWHTVYAELFVAIFRVCVVSNEFIIKKIFKR